MIFAQIFMSGFLLDIHLSDKHLLEYVRSFVVFSSSLFLRLLLELAIYSQAEFQGVLLCKPARSKEFAAATGHGKKTLRVASSNFKSAVLQP